MKKALVIGITGQDGVYLSDFLLKKGYEVIGTFRRTSHRSLERLESFDMIDKVELLKMDLIDDISINKTIKYAQADEIYNLGAQSFVGVSFDQPILTSNINGLGSLRVFETVKELSPHSKIYQASSSEMFGNSNEIKNEDSRMYPASPYGISKVYAHKAAQHYREAYEMFISCGILFNHESPFRGLEFVTRKITYSIARILKNKKDKIVLGNIKSKRDWGFAGDYVKSMWLMLQQDNPKDYVVATGESHSVEDFLEKAFQYVGIDNWREYVSIDEKFMRPQDIDNLIGDSSKAKKELGWTPSVSYEELVKMMIDEDKRMLEVDPHY
jgi:GDPmannose 4,6-dehydratase